MFISHLYFKLLDIVKLECLLSGRINSWCWLIEENFCIFNCLIIHSRRKQHIHRIEADLLEVSIDDHVKVLLIIWYFENLIELVNHKHFYVLGVELFAFYLVSH